MFATGHACVVQMKRVQRPERWRKERGQKECCVLTKCKAILEAAVCCCLAKPRGDRNKVAPRSVREREYKAMLHSQLVGVGPSQHAGIPGRDASAGGILVELGVSDRLMRTTEGI